MATLAIVSNGTSLDPALPIEREDVPVVEDRRMLNGQLRRAHRATKKRLRYGRQGLSEAERATWAAAHPWTTSYTHVDELGATRTVVTVSFRDDLAESRPTTNATYYDVSVEIEEV